MINRTQSGFRDKILLSDLEFYGTHGVLDIEKTTPQKFIITICLYQDLSLPGRTDDLKLTTDYSLVYKIVKSIVETQSFNLIEALADAIANKIISNFRIDEVVVKVNKPNAPLNDAVFSAVSVEISRGKYQL
jgi:dihydroneopterin aldolase